MPKMIFLNLPVRDLAASAAFFEALGGTVNAQFSTDSNTSIMLSDTIIVMIMTHERFATFTARPIGDPRTQAQALIALNVDSRADVDATVDKLVAAGGRADPNPSQDHGFMYGRSVEDPDGYVWELFWMDPAAVA
ncbi:MAG: lactoylglutathione lyase [Sphingomonadales bacterium]|nr:MAG: lactoylglutathione lyase [Sphingomonadales bacterium]